MAGGWGRLDARYTCGLTANELEVVGWAAGSICLGCNTGHQVCEHEPDLDLNVVGNAVLVHGLASDRSCGWAASVKQRGARACAVWVHWGRLGRTYTYIYTHIHIYIHIYRCLCWAQGSFVL